MNQKKIRTLRANSDIRQDIVTFDSSVSSPSNIEETYLLQSEITDAQGKAVISEVKNGTYSLEVLATDYNEVYNQANLVVTSNRDILINVTPLYGVTIQVKNSSAANIEGAVVKLTPSNGIQETKNTDVNGQAIFTAVPGGVYTIEISKENYQTVSTGGVIEGGETVTFDYTLAIMPKLVQITTAQSNYQLDTTYKYVSMLVVGKGYVVPYSSTTPTGYGGGSGMVAYKKNVAISSMGTATKIDVGFDSQQGSPTATKTGTYLRYHETDYSTSNERLISAANAIDRNGAVYVYFYKGSILSIDELDGYGSNAGSNNYLYSGGGSNADNGAGGDGTFGHQGGTGGITATKGTVIPLTSIFGGYGKGGSSYGSGTLPYYGSAGGYSGGDTGGYGQGVCYRWNYQSAGLVCLYYHNEPI